MLVGRSRRAPFFYQITERLFRHDWIDYVFDDAFRMLQRGLRQLKQEVVFTSHSLEILQQFFISLAFRFEFEAMDDLQQQINT